MAKNILIFSDGTGQIGGLRPEQRLSNVFKMYRASRPGPDNDIDPREQVAFYDAGLGADVGGGGLIRRVRNVLSSAFGTGISENVVDCYEAILRHYDPGDRVFLFGFSRGAYTARCVANVMNLCGVPTRLPDGSLPPRHGAALRRIAEEAVYTVYEHGSGKSRADYEAEREEQARRFRARYGSEGAGLDGESQGNVAPEFIGVFDTVAALGTATARWIIAGTFVASLALAALAWFSAAIWLAAILLMPSILLLLRLLGTAWSQLKVIRDFPKPGDRSWHFAAWDLEHYDQYLDTSVGFARHALAIDENRARFPRVPWASPEDVRRMDAKRPRWLDQVWFAGNHSDIGGSYPEDESRLSDVALRWMLDELETLPFKPRICAAKLAVYPSPSGIQHDEVSGMRESWPRFVPKGLRPAWRQAAREIKSGAKLHPSVIARRDLAHVPIHDRREPYRPSALRGHVLFESRSTGNATEAGRPASVSDSAPFDEGGEERSDGR